jgi:uncharacterized protein YbjT (DUF2867 family)
MKILILGATGRTGRHVITEALKRGHRVSAIARDPEKLGDEHIDVFRGTPYDYETVEKALEGCDAVINTLNISRRSDNPWAPLAAPADLISKAADNALKAMEKKGIRRYVALSTIGAGRSWKKIPLLLKIIVSVSNLRFAFRDHGKQEEILENSPADYTICRAPMLTNEISLSAAVAKPEAEKPENMYLSRNAAAEFFIRIIDSNEHIRQTINLSNKSIKTA